MSSAVAVAAEGATEAAAAAYVAKKREHGGGYVADLRGGIHGTGCEPNRRPSRYREHDTTEEPTVVLDGKICAGLGTRFHGHANGKQAIVDTYFMCEGLRGQNQPFTKGGGLPRMEKKILFTARCVLKAACFPHRYASDTRLNKVTKKRVKAWKNTNF